MKLYIFSTELIYMQQISLELYATAHSKKHLFQNKESVKRHFTVTF